MLRGDVQDLVLEPNFQSSMTSTQVPVRRVTGHWSLGIDDLAAVRQGADGDVIEKLPPSP
jgi:hypothetical protein